MAFDLPDDFFQRCLSPTDSSTPVRLQAALGEGASGMHVEACGDIDVEEYERLDRCKRTLLARPAPTFETTWGGPEDDRLHTRFEDGAWRVDWHGHTLTVVTASWISGFHEKARTWVIAPDEQLAKDFILDVARVTNDPRDAILVFHGGCWQRSHELYRATQQASFDDLVLARALKEQIRSDFQRFLASRSAHEELGLAWRRGALFLGPPGNGKTHCLRALVKELGVPSLYVQSIKHRYETEEANLKKVFARARHLRPCVLVLEDIDALVTNENRSFFLNQLDGFEKNVGLIVLATTNHPERIDRAIVDRPSRFDRKYHFDLPEAAERGAYLSIWQTKLTSRTHWPDATTDALVAATAGFSFAYIKELVTATLMRSVAGDGTFSSLVLEECASLRAQMQTGSGTKSVTHVSLDVADD